MRWARGGFFYAHDRAEQRQLVGVGELDVGRVARDHHHRLAQTLDQTRVIGRTQIVLPVSAKEQRSLENLRRLDRHRMSTVNGFAHLVHRRLRFNTQNRSDLIDGSIVFDGLILDALERIGDRHARDHGGVILGSVEEAVDELGLGRRAGRVVDGDVRARIVNNAQRRLDRFPPVGLAALDEDRAQEREPIAVAGFEIGEELVVVWPGDDDLVDIFAGVEEFDGALEDGFAAEVFVELGLGGAQGIEGVVVACVETGRRAGSRDDDGDAHGQWYGKKQDEATGLALHLGLKPSGKRIKL